jgi:hypothetical protein
MLPSADKGKSAQMDLSDKLSFILLSTFVCYLFYHMLMYSSDLEAPWYLFGNSYITLILTVAPLIGQIL